MRRKLLRHLASIYNYEIVKRGTAAPAPIAQVPISEPADIQLPAGMRELAIPGPGFPGFKLVIFSDPGPYDRIILENRSYSPIAGLLNEELGGRGTLIDLGANIGTIAFPVAAAGSSVIAVELLPENCIRLTLAAIINGCSRFRIFQAAVGDADGVLTYSGEEAWGVVDKESQNRAVAMRLDTIVAVTERENPLLLREPFALKIDIEGYEHEALKGGDTFISKYRPLIAFECNAFSEKSHNIFLCKQHLIDRGYTLFMQRAGVLVPKTASDLQEELVGDFVAIPLERLEETLKRIASHQRRQPTLEERLNWLESQLVVSDLHRRHVVSVIDGIGSSNADFALASAGLRQRAADMIESYETDVGSKTVQEHNDTVYEQLSPTIAEIASHFTRKLVVADIGCRWGFAEVWKQLVPHVRLYGFDPDSAECERLRPMYEGKDVVLVAKALADVPGTRDLYLTEDPACSSLYQPDPNLTTAMPELACASETGKTLIEVTTLDEWASANHVDEIDFLKLDTQGAELDILRGGQRLLRTVRALEVEVEFNPIYLGQPLFGDVDQCLRSLGFVLWRLSTMVHYSRYKPSLASDNDDTHFYDSRPITRPTLGGQLFWGHAYYVRSEIAAQSWRDVTREQLFRDAALMRILGFNDLVEAILERAVQDGPPGNVTPKVW